tara:strand:- start:778 stop:951 length:174 start_codon:yes stop_codon:yes gene_type:complete
VRVYLIWLSKNLKEKKQKSARNVIVIVIVKMSYTYIIGIKTFVLVRDANARRRRWVY